MTKEFYLTLDKDIEAFAKKYGENAIYAPSVWKSFDEYIEKHRCFE